MTKFLQMETDNLDGGILRRGLESGIHCRRKTGYKGKAMRVEEWLGLCLRRLR